LPIIYDPPGSSPSGPTGTGKTYGDIVEEVLSDFRGFTASSDQVTSLQSAMDTTTTTALVADLGIVSAGVIEIGDEQMWVKGVDPINASFTLLPKGRGWAGTRAVEHQAGDTVVIAPAYPRGRVKTAVNDAIQALWPTLYCVASTEFTYDDTLKVAWPLPDDFEFVLDVRYKDYRGNWQRVRAWETEHESNLTDFPTGMSLRLTQAIPPGQTVQVVYGRRPSKLNLETDAFTITGFDEQIADLVSLAVKARLIPMLDVARLQVTHVAADQLDQPRPLGSADALAKSFRSQYTARLQEERAVLNRRYPARPHITR
jgi:hypothetical protein